MTTPIPFDDFGGAGPILHFAHANGYPPACYRRFLEPLTDRFHVLAAHHRPLWPDSSPEALEGWHQIGQDLVRFFEENNLSGVIGVGHSLGAFATMHAALQKPALFQALVLIEPVFLMPAILQVLAETSSGQLSDDFPLVEIAKSRRNDWDSRKAAFDHYRRKRVFTRWSDEALWDYIWHGLERDDSGNIRLIYPPEWEARIYSLPPLNVWEMIPKIRQPTLGIRGSETDTLVPAAWQLWQMAQAKGTFLNIDGGSHLLTMEKPQETAEAILAFVDGLAP